MADSTTALLQALWRKAGGSPPLRVPCPSPAKARKLRFALYQAVRKFREGKAQADQDLQHALDTLSLGFDEADPSVLVFSDKSADETLAAVVEVLGVSPGESPRSAEELAMEASLAEVQRKLAELSGQGPGEPHQGPSNPSHKPSTPTPVGYPPSSPSRSTPYYTR